MKTINRSRLVFVFVLALAGLLALPIAALSQPTAAVPVQLPPPANLTLYGNVTLTDEYNSNVNPAAGTKTVKAQPVGDYELILNPSVLLNFDDHQGNIFNIGGNHSSLWFAHNATYNKVLDSGQMNFTHGNLTPLAANISAAGNLSGNISAAYDQTVVNTPDASALGLASTLQQNELKLNSFLGYKFSPIYADAGFSFTQKNTESKPNAAIFPVDTYSVPARVFYIFNGNICIGPTYTYTETDQLNASNGPGPVSGGTGRWGVDNVGALDAETNNLPLFGWGNLSGSTAVGILDNYLSAGSFGAGTGPLSTTTLYYNVKLKYEHDFGQFGNLSFALAGKRDVQPALSEPNSTSSKTAYSYLSSSVNLLVTYAPTTDWSFQASLGNFTHNAYLQSPRVDNSYGFGISATRIFRTNVSVLKEVDVSAGYTYQMNQSNSIGSTYNQSIVYLAGTVDLDKVLEP